MSRSPDASVSGPVGQRDAGRRAASQPASRSVSTSGTRAACAPAAASTTAASANAPSLPPTSPGSVSRARPVCSSVAHRSASNPTPVVSRLPNTSSASSANASPAIELIALPRCRSVERCAVRDDHRGAHPPRRSAGSAHQRSPSPRATMPRSTSFVPPRKVNPGACSTASASSRAKPPSAPGSGGIADQQARRVDDLVLVAGAEVLHDGRRELGRRPGGERTGDGQRHPPQRPQPRDQRSDLAAGAPVGTAELAHQRGQQREGRQEPLGPAALERQLAGDLVPARADLAEHHGRRARTPRRTRPR